MENLDRDMVKALLGSLNTRGLLGEKTYAAALDCVDARGDFPPLLQHPPVENKEANSLEPAENPQ